MSVTLLPSGFRVNWPTLISHRDATDNPHAVTAAQANADPAGTADAAITVHLGAFAHGDIVHANRTELDAIDQNLAKAASVQFAGLNVTGDVGVGTASPAARLHVAGLSTSEVARIDTGLVFSQVAPPATMTATLVASAGNVNTGTHYYYATYVTAIGETQICSPGNTGILVTTDTATSGQVEITVPASPDYRVTGIKIYRSQTGRPYYESGRLVATLENADQTYVDNKSDAQLSTINNSFYRDNTTNALIRIDSTRALWVGQRNTTFGYNAGNAAGTGSYNVFVGRNAGSGANTAIDSTFVGDSAGSNSSGSVAIGRQALYYGTGSGHIAVGYLALMNTQSGTGNIGIGSCAGLGITTGSRNIMLGHEAGRYIGNISDTLVVTSRAQTTLAAEQANAILYGTMAASYADQRLTINADIAPAATDRAGLTVRGLAGQSGDLQQWKNAAGFVVSRVAADGRFNCTVLPIYANNAAAVAGGLVAGDMYRTGGDPDAVCVVH